MDLFVVDAVVDEGLAHAAVAAGVHGPGFVAVAHDEVCADGGAVRKIRRVSAEQLDLVQQPLLRELGFLERPGLFELQALLQELVQFRLQHGHRFRGIDLAEIQRGHAVFREDVVETLVVRQTVADELVPLARQGDEPVQFLHVGARALDDLAGIAVRLLDVLHHVAEDGAVDLLIAAGEVQPERIARLPALEALVEAAVPVSQAHELLEHVGVVSAAGYGLPGLVDLPVLDIGVDLDEHRAQRARIGHDLLCKGFQQREIVEIEHEAPRRVKIGREQRRLALQQQRRGDQRAVAVFERDAVGAQPLFRLGQLPPGGRLHEMRFCRMIADEHVETLGVNVLYKDHTASLRSSFEQQNQYTTKSIKTINLCNSAYRLLKIWTI